MYYGTPAMQTGSYSRPMPSLVGYNYRDEVASIHYLVVRQHKTICNMSSLSMSVKSPHNKHLSFIRTLLPDNIYRSLAKIRNPSIQAKRRKTHGNVSSMFQWCVENMRATWATIWLCVHFNKQFLWSQIRSNAPRAKTTEVIRNEFLLTANFV